MGTSSKVSFKALRVLTYTILIKAVIDSVLIISRAILSETLITVAYTAAFVNIVACVMCLIGVTSLSKRFVYVLRLMVTVLILVSVMILVRAAGIFFADMDPEPAIITYNEHALIATVRLLIGAAYLFLMKGFGEAIEEDEISASATEKTGIVYMCCSCAIVLLEILVGAVPGIPVSAMVMIADITGVIIEVLMYRRAYGAAFRLWRKYTLAGTDQWSQIQ